MKKFDDKTLGILYIITSAFFFALMNLFVRLSGDIPVMQKCFFRNFVALFVAFLLLKKTHVPFRIGKGNMSALLIRALAGTLGILCNFYAVGHLNLADASILNKLSPFFTIIFCIFLLGEKVRPPEWLALAIAFVGALFVIKPSFHNANLLYSFIGMLGGIMAGLAYACVRKLGTRGVKGPVIVLFFSAFSCLFTLPQFIFDFTPMTAKQVVFLLLAGCAAAVGQFTITAAYSHAPAREISVFDYSQIIFASLLGFLCFGQIPDRLSIIGYVIIVGAAIFKWEYNMRETA